jgi:hypothetical protein
MMAPFIRRLLAANAITRMLFLVDRIPLAKEIVTGFREKPDKMHGRCEPALRVFSSLHVLSNLN